MKEQIENQIREVLKNLRIEDVSFTVEHPENFTNGDYSTNVTMVCAKKIGKNPKELAENIKIELEKNLPKEISKVEVAGPGFINFYLSREFFTEKVKEILEKGEDWGKNSSIAGKKVMVEYTDPNPFKPFHIGHLMTNAIGESISRVFEFSGAKVVRANYQGDVGPHVAKAIYSIINSDKFKEVGLPIIIGSPTSYNSEAQWIGECYSKGSNLYDSDENAKKEIDDINRKIYSKNDNKINAIYDWGRKVTLDAFKEIYKILGTKFDYYFFESEMAPIGERIVRKNTKRWFYVFLFWLKKIFISSNNAIIFNAERYDSKLHTRVFINSQGLPTYETKEIGLTITKFKKVENLNLSIVVTAKEQAEYMKVVQKAISLIYPDLEKKMKHITHGMMRFADGKMSSRKGNVITGESLIKDVNEKIQMKMIQSNPNDKKFVFENKGLKEKSVELENIAKKVGVSALKYSILKSSLGSDIIYDFDKSISFDGDSGPYLQYSAVRANSILEKSKSFDLENKKEIPEIITDLEKLLYQFPDAVKYSYNELAPHHIAIYLTKLASEFNTFYGNTQILTNDNAYITYHLNLVKAFYQTMKNGLWLLGIEVPERM